MKVYNRQVETIVSEGLNKFKGKTTAKTMRGWINGMLSKASKTGNDEMFFIYREFLNAYNFYHPEKIATGEIKGWKGKSGITNIQKLPDKVIITRFQRPSKDEEPKEVNIEIENYELKPVLDFFSKLSVGDKVKTKVLALDYSRALKLGHKDWDDFFSDRKQHNLFTNLLGYLDSEGLINYSGGVSEVLKTKMDFQLIL